MGYQEKRLNKRINISLPINYETLGLDRKELGNTISKDISETGIKLILKEFYPPQTKFLIQINLKGINKAIETVVETVWSFNIQFSNAYYNGLRFIELNARNKEILSEYIATTQLLNS